jgi:signal peptidase I
VLVALALGVAFLLRSFVVQVFWIPSSSMVPTLQVEDRMVVEKLTYRVRNPERGEVVVFRPEPTGERPDRPFWWWALRAGVQFVGIVPLDQSDLVKRVAGLPGETIEIRGGTLIVDGVALAEPYLDGTAGADFGPVTVPDGHLFFLGDNRTNSSDSRGRLWFVPRDRVVGRALAVVWPLGNAARLTGELPVPQPAVPGS